MREKTCCFTGHRKIPINSLKEIEEGLEKEISELTLHGITDFAAGGALGFDTMAAQAVLRAREQNPLIRLILVLPCITQSHRWSDYEKKLYEDIRSRADKVVYTSQEYTSSCMLKRNRQLVDCSSVCICYLKQEKGGTAYTVDYAKKQKIEIINLAEKQSSGEI